MHVWGNPDKLLLPLISFVMQQELAITPVQLLNPHLSTKSSTSGVIASGLSLGVIVG